jgi:hypothetical protein
MTIIFVQQTAAARALMDIPELSAEDVAKKAMRVASDMCVYTNDNYRTEIIHTTDVVVKKEDNTTTNTVVADDKS